VQSLRAVRRKIRSVQNIQQITLAMKMVAAAKLRRAQGQVTAGKPYFEKMQQLMERLGPEARRVEHPLLAERPEVRASALVVITGNRGLCGSYNANLLRTAERFMAAAPNKVWKLLTVGRKGNEFLTRRTHDIESYHEQLDVGSSFAQAKVIIDAITGLFESGTVDEVYVAYTEFVTTMSQRPKVIRFLPLEPAAAEESEETPAQSARAEFLFEPEAAEFMGSLLPRYVDTQFYHMLLEALTSEFGARMTAMTAATENAGEMIKDLTLQYNRSRQSAITTEISEVVGGAEALATEDG